jgi:hypothetical protein
MKKHVFLFSFLLITLSVFSQTVIPGGSVSGLWSKDKSPYQVTGDILVAVDSVLKIEPGVVVEFQGHYKLNVHGQLLAQGALGDSVVFTIKDTTGLSIDSIPDGGWGGIRFEGNNTLDSSMIEYCKVQYGKVMYPDSCGGGIFVKDYQKLVIANSEISYNILYGGKTIETFTNMNGGGIACLNSSPLIINNLICNNSIYCSSYFYFENYNHLKVKEVYGGGIVCFNSNSHIINNSIFRNTIFGIPYWNKEQKYYEMFLNRSGGGAAVAILNNSNLTINQNIIIGNIGINWSPIYGGGILCDNSKSNIINNYLGSNQANDGGGICLVNNSSANIDNNLIKSNNARSLDYFIDNDCKGGGIAIINSNATIFSDTIINNKVEGLDGDSPGNAFGGGIYLQNSYCKINKNMINNNYILAAVASYDPGWCGNSNGGGIYSDGNSYVNIDNNIIKGNKAQASCGDGYANGGGIYIERKYLYTFHQLSKIVNNFIINNTLLLQENPFNGGGIYASDSILIVNNVISYNSISSSFGSRGAGIYCIGYNKVINNTICYNNDHGDCDYLSNYLGSGIFCKDTTNLLINNIIWGKDSCSTLIHLGKYIYCDVEDTIISGIGNLNQVPKFDSTSTSPFSLSWNSPCIDKGSPDTTGLLLPQFDIAGNPRIMNGRVDMGAYEYQGSVGLPEVRSQKSEVGINIYPNPANGVLSIEYRVSGKANVNISIYDLLGNKVDELDVSQAQHDKILYDAGKLRSGVYFMKVTTNEGGGTTKFIKL